jgi:hypothetical protein
MPYQITKKLFREKRAEAHALRCAPRPELNRNFRFGSLWWSGAVCAHYSR